MPDVEGDTDGGERLDRGGLAEAAGVERPQAGHLLHQRHRRRRRLRVVRAHQHVRFQPRFEVFHFRGGQVVEGGGHQALGQRRLDRGGHRAPGRDQGEHLAALLDQGVGHGDHDLAGQRLRAAPAPWRWRCPRVWPRPRGRPRRRRRCRAPASSRSESGQRRRPRRRPRRPPAPRRVTRA